MYIDGFAEYLEKEKQMAKNSLSAYLRDIDEFLSFESGRGIDDIRETSSTEIVAYLNSLKMLGKSAATINRKLASLRSFFNYLLSEKGFESNPTNGIKSPRIEKKSLEYLSIDEVEKLLECPDETPKGKRDSAILEVLYATGIKASELIEMNIEDMNLRMGFISCYGETSKTRIVPLGRPARAALEEYVDKIRGIFLKGKEEEKALFVNYLGERISRQGLWKILKEYGEKAELNHKLTPNTLRNSFAVHMLHNGADLKSLQELMGYEDITAMQIYLDVTRNRIKDVYDRAHPRAR